VESCSASGSIHGFFLKEGGDFYATGIHYIGANLAGQLKHASATGYALQSNPQCKRVCQTLAQHLINHGWNKLFGLQ
jgi:hypothetical protein